MAVGTDFARLPFSLKVLLENLLRHEDGRTVATDDIRAMGTWLKAKTSDREIAFRPARVLMQDFTGVPAVVDLAAMRNAMEKLGGQAKKINPAGAGRPRHRPLGDGRLLRQGRVIQEERRPRIRAQPGALHVPALGRTGLRQFPRRAAGHRHLPPGQPRVPRAGPSGRRSAPMERSALIPTASSAPTATRP